MEGKHGGKGEVSKSGSIVSFHPNLNRQSRTKDSNNGKSRNEKDESKYACCIPEVRPEPISQEPGPGSNGGIADQGSRKRDERGEDGETGDDGRRGMGCA